MEKILKEEAIELDESEADSISRVQVPPRFCLLHLT